MRIHDAMLHERGERRWIGLPAREYKDPAGARQFAKIIDFADDGAKDRFQAAVLVALDDYFAGGSA
jgi:hypothetical protein